VGIVGYTYDGPLRLPIRVMLGETPAAALLEDVRVPAPDGALIDLEHLAVTDRAQPAASLVNHDERAAADRGRLQRPRGGAGRGGGGAEAGAGGEVPAPRGVRMVWGGQYESLAEAKARLMWVIPGVVVAILDGAAAGVWEACGRRC
jgi:cobalt-zinc-cadmium resistance protein CzcA